MLQRMLNELPDLAQDAFNASQVSISHLPWHCTQITGNVYNVLI